MKIFVLHNLFDRDLVRAYSTVDEAYRNIKDIVENHSLEADDTGILTNGKVVPISKHHFQDMIDHDIKQIPVGLRGMFFVNLVELQ